MAGQYISWGPVTPTIVSETGANQYPLAGEIVSETQPTTASLSGASLIAISARMGNIPVNVSLAGRSRFAARARTRSVKFSGATYYVSAAGNDSKDGKTPATAWLTIGKVNATTLNPGDRVYFRARDTFNDAPLTPTTSGTTLAPITFGSYDPAGLNGQASIVGGAGAGNPGIFLADVSGFIIEELVIPGVSNGNAGIYCEITANAQQTQGVVIRNCVLSGFDWGILIGDDSPTQGFGFSHVTISGCEIKNCATQGISLYNDSTGVVYSHADINVLNCLVHDIPGNGVDGSGNGINIAATDGGSVSGCVVHDCGVTNTTFSGAAGIATFVARGIVISWCEAYNIKQSTLGSDGDGIDMDDASVNCIIEWCYTHNNDGPGLYAFNRNSSSGCVIRFCISENDAQKFFGGIAIDSISNTMTGLAVYNNTIYNNVRTCLAIEGVVGLTGCVIANNVFIASGSAVFVDTTSFNPTGVKFRGNDYYTTGTPTFKWNGTTYTSLASWQAATSQDPQAKAVDPLLVSPGSAGTATPVGDHPTLTSLQLALAGYRMQTGSPMRFAGLNLSTLFSIAPGPSDFWSDAIDTSLLSIGADCSAVTFAQGAAFIKAAAKAQVRGVANLFGKVFTKTNTKGTASASLLLQARTAIQLALRGTIREAVGLVGKVTTQVKATALASGALGLVARAGVAVAARAGILISAPGLLFGFALAAVRGRANPAARTALTGKGMLTLTAAAAPTATLSMMARAFVAAKMRAAISASVPMAQLVGRMAMAVKARADVILSGETLPTPPDRIARVLAQIRSVLSLDL